MKIRIKLTKSLGEILQPLVGKVSKFKGFDHTVNWTAANFPRGSWTAACISSLAKWAQNKKDADGRWRLGANTVTCPLCRERQPGYDRTGRRKLCRECPLYKFGGSCFNRNDAYNAAAHSGNKQPLIEALELASVYALVNKLREKCEETVRENKERIDEKTWMSGVRER